MMSSKIERLVILAATGATIAIVLDNLLCWLMLDQYSKQLSMLAVMLEGGPNGTDQRGQRQGPTQNTIEDAEAAEDCGHNGPPAGGDTGGAETGRGRPEIGRGQR
jgi:hypothetical protein